MYKSTILSQWKSFDAKIIWISKWITFYFGPKPSNICFVYRVTII